jgi:hypothetical protein
VLELNEKVKLLHEQTLITIIKLNHYERMYPAVFALGRARMERIKSAKQRVVSDDIKSKVIDDPRSFLVPSDDEQGFDFCWSCFAAWWR